MLAKPVTKWDPMARSDQKSEQQESGELAEKLGSRMRNCSTTAEPKNG